MRNQFSGKSAKSRYLMQLLAAELNKKVEALIGNGVEANTLKGYKTTEKRLTGFFVQHYSYPLKPALTDCQIR